jgi:ABC-2 type transport system permease protein
MSTDQQAGPDVDCAPAAAGGTDTPVSRRPVADADARPPSPLGPVPSWLRFVASELALVFRRPRNLALLGVVAAVPIFLGVVLRLTLHSGGGGGPEFLNQLAGNGVFLALVVLTLAQNALLLPLSIAVVAGDTIAGEASQGTLRGLLTVPVGRTRLLAVKCAALAVFSVVVCLLVTLVSLVTGLLLFHTGPVTLLSGTTVSIGSGVLRVLAVAAYAAVAMMALSAIGLAASTLTQHPVGAIAGLLVLVVASEICDQVQQLSAIHAYLPTHWWLSWDGLFRSPMDLSGVATGLVSFAVYAAIFLSIAWARLTSVDVTS